MSSLPGLRLEDYLQWNYDLVVLDGFPDANTSVALAEALGTSPRTRPRLTPAEFAPLVALFEEHRELIEYRLRDFDEDEQSWRDYASSAFDFIPDALYDQGAQLIKNPLPRTP